MSDQSVLVALQQANVASNTDFTNSGSTVLKQCQRFASIPIPAGAAATSYSLPALRLDRVAKIISVRYADTGAITANSTNFVTLSLAYNDDAGGSATTVASIATTAAGTGNVSANQSKAVTVVATAAVVPANQMLLARATQTASGVAFGPGFMIVCWEESQ